MDENTAARRLLTWMWAGQGGTAYLAWDADPERGGRRIGHALWPDRADDLATPDEHDHRARFDPMLWRVSTRSQPRRIPGRVLWAEVDRLNSDQWRLVERLDAAVTTPAPDGPQQVWVRLDRWASAPTPDHVRQANDRLAARLDGTAPRLMRWPTKVEGTPAAGWRKPRLDGRALVATPGGGVALR
ncbi:hypothetical protein ACFW53_02440 [Nocardiopsis dassonvillei]|uniref:hypothetical protein n=1 Tax=Nocardiopsis dassonvillei TaxID=2014 RepID=UPI00366F666B